MSAARRSAFVLTAALLCGCADDESPSPSEPPPTSSASASSGQGGSGGGAGGESVGGGGAQGGEGGISVTATRGALELPFSLDAEGLGSAEIGAIQVTGAVGTVEIGGEALAAVAYERQPFNPYVLYQLLAVDDDRLFVVWLYCQGNELVHLYYEGTDGTALAEEAATGTCDGLEMPSTAEVAFSALTMPYPELLQGYSVDGPDLHLDGEAPGSLDLGGGPMVVLPFEDVDCTACGQGGWHEIHTLLWDPAGARLCFAIFYLFQPGDPVLLTYSLTLPDLSDPAGSTQLDATWTTP